MLDDITIFKKLNKNLDIITEKYGEENVLGIFAFGKVNAEGVENLEELETEAIIFPTFSDACLIPMFPSISLVDNIRVRDLRWVYNAVMEETKDLSESLYTQYRIINPRYEILFERYFLNNRDKFHYDLHRGDEDAKKLLQTGIIEILRTAFNLNSASIGFIKHLSDAEKKGLTAILDHIGDEGTISIAKLCAEVDISRQVFNNLLAKMKEEHMAIISNFGPHGTFIKILDYRLLNF